MKKIWIFIVLLSLVVSSCVNPAQGPASDAAPLFVTSTLPPTRPGLSLPTETQSSTTPDPSITTTPGTPGATESGGTETTTGPCKDSAVMLEDVTVPDNTLMSRGEKFTKT
ncbi:MAG: hypothetical protein ACM3Y8_01210 [Byssovorax cruenta]